MDRLKNLSLFFLFKIFTYLCNMKNKLRTEPKDIITLIEGSEYSAKELKDLLQHIFALYETQRDWELVQRMKLAIQNKSNHHINDKL